MQQELSVRRSVRVRIPPIVRILAAILTPLALVSNAYASTDGINQVIRAYQTRIRESIEGLNQVAANQDELVKKKARLRELQKRLDALQEKTGSTDAGAGGTGLGTINQNTAKELAGVDRELRAINRPAPTSTPNPAATPRTTHTGNLDSLQELARISELQARQTNEALNRGVITQAEFVKRQARVREMQKRLATLQKETGGTGGGTINQNSAKELAGINRELRSTNAPAPTFTPNPSGTPRATLQGTGNTTRNRQLKKQKQN